MDVISNLNRVGIILKMNLHEMIKQGSNIVF